MTASTHPTTPTMKLPVRQDVSDHDIETFIKQASRLTLAQVVSRVDVTERVNKSSGDVDVRSRKYTVLLEFYPPEEYTKEYAITSEQVHESLAFNFAGRLKKALQQEQRALARIKDQDQSVGKGTRVRSSGGNVAEADDDEGGVAHRSGRDDELDDDEDDEDRTRSSFRRAALEYEDDDAATPERDLEDIIERLEDHDEADEELDVSAVDKAQLDAKADLLSETFKLAVGERYCSNFSFDILGGKSAQFDLEVGSRLGRLALTTVLGRGSENASC